MKKILLFVCFLTLLSGCENKVNAWKDKFSLSNIEQNTLKTELSGEITNMSKDEYRDVIIQINYSIGKDTYTEEVEIGSLTYNESKEWTSKLVHDTYKIQNIEYIKK